MVNCMPVFIAREGYWQKQFQGAEGRGVGTDSRNDILTRGGPLAGQVRHGWASPTASGW